MKNVVTVIGFVLSLAASGLSQAVEPTDLGLTKVKETRSSIAYLKVDQDFSDYDKIFIAEIDTTDVEVNGPSSHGAYRDSWAKQTRNAA